MSLSNLLTPNSYNLFANNVNSPNVDLVTINHQPYPPGGGFVPVLVPNKFLRTTNVGPTQMFWGDVNAAELVHGTANQLLVTNSLGTQSQWASNIVVPGSFDCVGNGVFQQDLAVQNELNVTNDLQVINGDVNVTSGNLTISTGDTTVQKLNVIGNLQCNGASGNIGDYLTKTTLTTQAWVTPPNIKMIRLATNFLVQDLNASASLLCNFDVTPFTNLAIGSTAIVPGISMPNATSFLIGLTATYDIDFCVNFTTASTGLGNSVLQLYAEVNGLIISTRPCVSNSGGYSICGKIPSVILTQGSTLRIRTQRVVGTGSLLTSTSGVPPNSVSTISISLVNTV